MKNKPLNNKKLPWKKWTRYLELITEEENLQAKNLKTRYQKVKPENKNWKFKSRSKKEKIKN